MKVLIVGSGGREHALAWKISQSPLLTKLYAASGNAGISQIAECVPIQPNEIDGLLNFAKKEQIDLTVIGPESPLVDGIRNRFEQEGLRLFGPAQSGAKLEGSKAFAKDKMHKYGVPTAHYEAFSNVNEAKHYVIETEMPVVIKADGLAAGKGVAVCRSSQEAVDLLNQIMTKNVFGDAGRKVVIEELLEGEEFSILVLTDGEKIIPLASSQDHKKAYDFDRGPNTGGMGAYSPCPQITADKLDQMIELTVRPIIHGMKREGTPYQGLLYAGIMMTQNGPYVLEYNCRFGDPEAQAVLPRLKSDLLPVMVEIADGKLKTEALEWHDKACLTVVIASGGYPGSYKKGYEIHGLEAVRPAKDVFVFHAGTEFNDQKKIVSSGGRVLTVTALGDNLRDAYERAYQAVAKIHFTQSFCRRDIGRRVLEVFK